VFAIAADFDVTTGITTTVPEVVNIWSAQHTYVPSGGALDEPDRSPWFEMVTIRVNSASKFCFRVIAYNAAGAAPPSAIACGSYH
jgi:hypothetical protein